MFRTLKIPASNLVQDLEYTFKIVVSNLYKDVEFTKSVIVRKLTQQTKTLDSIGIDNKLITVSPERGLSGTQKFTAKYVYDNVKALKKCNDWKYTISIIIPGSDKISMSSSQSNDYVDFYVPGSKTSNTTIKIQFAISNQEEFYSASRSIMAL